MQPYLTSGAVFKSFKGAHKIEGIFEKRNKKLQQDLEGVNKKYWFLTDVFDNDLPATIFMVDIDRSFPFFASYIGNMRFKQPNGLVESDIVVNIHPVNRTKTKILLLDFSNKIDLAFFNTFQFNDWIELFAEVIACSNSWLVNKNYWDNHVQENVKQFILKKSKSSVKELIRNHLLTIAFLDGLL